LTQTLQQEGKHGCKARPQRFILGSAPEARVYWPAQAQLQRILLFARHRLLVETCKQLRGFYLKFCFLRCAGSCKVIVCGHKSDRRRMPLINSALVV